MLGDAFGYLTDGANWSGSNGIGAFAVQQLLLTVTALRSSRWSLGLPLALYLGHRRRGGFLAVNISNVGRAVPVFAVLLVLSLGPVGSDELGPYGRAGLATLIALVLFALPPLITNAYVGVTEVDRDVVEAARGMGMSGRQVFTVGRAAAGDAGGPDRRPDRAGPGLGDRDDRRAGRRARAWAASSPGASPTRRRTRWWPARSWSALGALLLEGLAVLGGALRRPDAAGPAGPLRSSADTSVLTPPEWTVGGAGYCSRAGAVGCPSDTRGARPRDTEGGTPMRTAAHALARRRRAAPRHGRLR